MIARDLLCALRAAGCEVFLDEETQVYVSPPSRPVDWPSDVETAIDMHERDLRDLVLIETVFAAMLDALSESSDETLRRGSKILGAAVASEIGKT